MNILFVRLSYIGDILHATAAARWIKQHYQEAILHWIVTPSMAELLEGNPYVDVIIPWARDEYEAHSKKLHIGKMWSMWWDLRKQLKPYHFDVAIDVQGRLISGLVLLASGAPLRLGLGNTKELNWLFTNHKAHHESHHVIERYLAVAKLLPHYIESSEPVVNTSDHRRNQLCDSCPSLEMDNGAHRRNKASDESRPSHVGDVAVHQVGKSITDMDLYISEIEQNRAKQQLDDYFASSSKSRIGLVLGTSWPSKEWPPHKWLQLVESMTYRSDFVCLGGKKEVVEYQSFLQGLESAGHTFYNALGQTTLREMAAFISQCDVVVACDTGGLHMSVALGVPVVALFGPTEPREWGPLDGAYRIIQNTIVPCLGCRKRRCPKGKAYCMTGIDVVKVKAAIIELLERNDNYGKI